MLVPVLLFLVGFGLLIKGGDWFVDGSVGIARRFRLPELLIGATVVSIGTTLPEVMVSGQAALQGNAGRRILPGDGRPSSVRSPAWRKLTGS